MDGYASAVVYLGAWKRLGTCLSRLRAPAHSCQSGRMRGPFLYEPPPMMTAAQQLQSAQHQLEAVSRPLDGVTWAIHPLDLEELRTAIGAADGMASLRFTIAANPGLEGKGPWLLWPGEWPEEWA